MLRKKLHNLFWGVIGLSLFLGLGLLLPFFSHASVKSQPTLVSLGCSSQLAPGANSFDILAQADSCYQQGNRDIATQLYRQVKPPFTVNQNTETLAEPIYDSEELSPAGRVYWRNAEAALAQGTQLESKIFIPLFLLIDKDPNFIPAYVALAQACRDNPEGCQKAAKEGQPKNELEVLEQATNLFPNEPDLLTAKMDALVAKKDYLEASITARQFALFFPDHPSATDFASKADQYMKSYQNQLKGTIIPQVALSCGLDIFTGNWRQQMSGCHVALMLLEGESSFGSKFAEQAKAEFQSQGKLVENQEIINYVKGIGEQLTPLMGRNNFEYEFYVVDDNSLNAFALPGGKVFVNTGTIKNTNSEAELAGVLSHEIAHAVFSHGFQSVAQSSFLNSLGQVIPYSDFLFSLAQNAHSRNQERQADILGTRVLNGVGYAADGLHNFMVTLKQESGDNNVSWLSTHPAPSERVEYLEKLIEQNGYNRYALEGVENHKHIQDLL